MLGERSIPERAFGVLGNLTLQDLRVSVAVPLGVEQHEVAAGSTFDADREGEVPFLILPQGKRVGFGGNRPSTSSTGKRLMVSDSAEPHTGHALRPSCWSVSKTSAMKAGRHRMSSYTSIRPVKANVDAEAGPAATAPCAWSASIAVSAATPHHQ